MNRSQRIGLGAVLALQVALGLLLAISLPLWTGHEGDYFHNIRFLVENGRLPARSDFEGAERGADIAQATQGPLFFYVAAPLVALLDDGAAVPPGVHPNLVCEGIVASVSYPNVLTSSYNWPMSGAPAAGLSIRILNLLLGLGTTTIVYFTARRLPLSTHALALVAAAFAAFFPQIFSLNVFISGESLLLLVSSLNLFFALRLIQGSAVRLLDMSLLITTAVMGPLIKTNGYVLVVATAVVLMLLLFRNVLRTPRSQSTRMVVIGVTLLVLGLTAVGVFNLAQYGSVIGRYQGILTVAISGLGDVRIENLAYTLRDTLLDYTSAFPVQREKVLWIYIAGAVIGLGAFCLLTLGQFSKRNWRVLGPKMVLVLYAVAALVLVLIRGNLTDEFAPDKAYAPVRYYLSGLPALAIISAVGWDAISRTVFRNRLLLRLGGKLAWYGRFSMANPLGFAWAAVWLSLVVLSVSQSLQSRPQAYLLTAAHLEEIQDQSSTLITTGSASIPSDVPHLRALQYSIQDDGMLLLMAYLSVEQTPDLNQVATVTISDQEGRTSICEIVPHNGLYPVTRWEPDQVVVVPMEIPNCVTPVGESMAGPLDVSIGWRSADSKGEYVDPSVHVVSGAILETDLPRYDNCMPNLGVIGENFQVVQFNGPNILAAGETYIPSVNWYVRDTIENSNLSRVFTLTHRETGQAFTCQGVPRLGDYPIDLWRRGEIVYFDQCALPIPEDAPAGTYALSIGLMDNATGRLLPVEPGEGTLMPEGLLGIAELALERSS